MDISLEVYTASWCGQCKTLKPALQELPYSVIEVDVDTYEGRELAIQHNVKGLPTVRVYGDTRFLGTIKNYSYTVDGVKDAISQLVEKDEE